MASNSDIKYISDTKSPVSYEVRCVATRSHYQDEFTTPFGDPHFTYANHNEPVSTEHAHSYDAHTQRVQF